MQQDRAGFSHYVMQEAAQLFSARTAVRHEMALPEASERAAYFGPVLAPLAMPPHPPNLDAQRPPPPEVPCPSQLLHLPLLMLLLMADKILGSLVDMIATSACMLSAEHVGEPADDDM